MKTLLRALAAIAALTAAAPAYAAAGIGGAIDPVVYELMVFVMAIFLWVTDKTMEWLLYDLILGWHR